MNHNQQIPFPLMRLQKGRLTEIKRRAQSTNPFLIYGLTGGCLDFRISCEGRNIEGERAYLSESGFSGLAGFSGFRFAHLAFFAITENSDNANTDERLQTKDELVKS